MKRSAIVILVVLAISLCGIAGCEPNIVCQAVKIENGEYVLDGELTLPKTGFNLPAVVIVSGSGGIDMDGSVGAQKPYKNLAYKLAEKGIASIRFNKVTFQYADEIKTQTNFTVDDEYFYAISSCVDILRKTECVDGNKIYLLGHSLGSQMVCQVLKNDSTLAGGIIMAGTTSHILDLLMEQTARQDETLYREYLPYYQKAKSLTEVPTGEEHYYYFGAYSAYWVSYNKLDLSAVAQTRCPLLIMQGGLDLQVTQEHFESYKTLLSGKTDVTFKEYAELNHLFTDGRGETLQTAYRRFGTIPDEVVNDITQFILN